MLRSAYTRPRDGWGIERNCRRRVEQFERNRRRRVKQFEWNRRRRIEQFEVWACEDRETCGVTAHYHNLLALQYCYKRNRPERVELADRATRMLMAGRAQRDKSWLKLMLILILSSCEYSIHTRAVSII